MNHLILKSEASLNRYFSKEAAQTASEYIIIMKMERFTQLLGQCQSKSPWGVTSHPLAGFFSERWINAGTRWQWSHQHPNERKQCFKLVNHGIPAEATIIRRDGTVLHYELFNITWLFKINLIFFIVIYLFCVWMSAHNTSTAPKWESKDSLQELALSPIMWIAGMELWPSD